MAVKGNKKRADQERQVVMPQRQRVKAQKRNRVDCQQPRRRTLAVGSQLNDRTAPQRDPGRGCSRYGHGCARSRKSCCSQWIAGVTKNDHPCPRRAGSSSTPRVAAPLTDAPHRVAPPGTRGAPRSSPAPNVTAGTSCVRLPSSAHVPRTGAGSTCSVKPSQPGVGCAPRWKALTISLCLKCALRQQAEANRRKWHAVTSSAMNSAGCHGTVHCIADESAHGADRPNSCVL